MCIFTRFSQRMYLAIDAGHTVIKVFLTDATFTIVEEWATSVAPWQLVSDIAGQYSIQHGIIAAPGGLPADFDNQIIAVGTSWTIMGPDTPLPLKNAYHSPQTLGYDRIAAACGAWKLFPRQDSLVVDMGTCINYEWVSSLGEYLGGAISPGFRMRYQAMHNITGNLPLIDDLPTGEAFPGKDTRSCLRAGVETGIISEVEHFIQVFLSASEQGKVLITGGDGPQFAKLLKSNIFARPKLVAEGLLEILRFNISE